MTNHAESNRQTVRRLYELCINPGHLDALGEYISSAFVGAQDARGPDGFRKPIEAVRTAFPDVVYTLDEIVAEDDRVVVHWVWRGTHTGPFRSFAPTGKPVANAGVAFFTLADGKITGSRIETDRLGFLQSIGAIASDPAFGPPPPR